MNLGRRFVLALISLSLCGAASHAVGAEPKAVSESCRPNIVVILADDLGYADLGFQGGTEIPTPRLDALAASGTRFTSGYVSGPYCSPTRAGFLTGRYQQRFGHEFNPGGAQRAGVEPGLPLTETTLADRLQEAGYATGLVGKWHLGGASQFHPQQRGFQEFFGFLGGAHTYFNNDQAVLFRGTDAVQEPAYLTDALGREAVAFIDRHQQKPFFLYLAFNAVHAPMEATDERLQRFAEIPATQRRTYAAMLAAMDDAVGQVLDKLHTANLDENTLIFFFSDNGGPTMKGTTINASNNAPLRGSKRTTLEGGIRVPFVIRWPGRVPAGAVYEHPVIQLDVQPTALAAAGVAIKDEWNLDGADLLPFISSPSTEKPHDTLYWRLGDQTAIRRGDWKLVSYDLNADGISGRGVTEPRLYNLAADIGESQNLAASHPQQVQELQQLWDDWNSQLATPLWGPRSTSR